MLGYSRLQEPAGVAHNGAVFFHAVVVCAVLICVLLRDRARMPLVDQERLDDLDRADGALRPGPQVGILETPRTILQIEAANLHEPLAWVGVDAFAQHRRRERRPAE